MMKKYIHQTACVSDPEAIGDGTRIWRFSSVLKNAQVGRNCILGQNVMVDTGAVIGNDCKIQNNVSIYNGVILKDGVFCGPSCVFTNVLNPRARVERKHEFKKTTVGEDATIGANATIVCGVKIGQGAMIGAGAVVTRDVPDFALVVGVPAKHIGWVSRHGVVLNEDMRCPETGVQYKLDVRGCLIEMGGAVDKQ